MDEMALHLNVDNMNNVHWWVDASYGTHPDLKGHTGATMSIGKGCITSMSKKQKVNTTSSTISELVGVHESSPQALWTKSFLRNQGFHVDEATLYQDNKSAILLEENGRASSSSRTKHINIRYFFIKDQIDSGNVKVIHCPTDQMVADYFTKPLQGRKFREFRARIMGLPPEPEWKTVPVTQQPKSILKVGLSRTTARVGRSRLRPSGVCWNSTNRFSALREQ